MKFRYLYRTLLSLTLFLLPYCLWGQQPSGTSEQKEIIEKIINATNIAGSIEATPMEISTQFASNPFGLEPEKNEEMIRLFREAYSDSLMVKVRETFTTQYNSEHAKEASQWLEEEPALSVLNAKEDYYSLQGIRNRVVRRYELEQEPPSAEREEVIQSLLTNTGATESALESQTILFRSIISAFGILNQQQNLSEAQIDGIVNNYRTQIQPQLQQELRNQLLVMYYDLGNEKLRTYKNFYETEAGKWLKSTSDEAVQSAYSAAGDRFVESVANSN